MSSLVVSSNGTDSLFLNSMVSLTLVSIVLWVLLNSASIVSRFFSVVSASRACITYTSDMVLLLVSSSAFLFMESVSVASSESCMCHAIIYMPSTPRTAVIVICVSLGIVTIYNVSTV